MPLDMDKKGAHDAHVDEKHIDTEVSSLGDTSIEGRAADEALQLVGKERTAQFSDEYNRRLRRKLVRDGHGYFLRS